MEHTQTTAETALTPKAAARYVNCAEGTLRLWRNQGRGPRYFRAGKLVRYRRADLDAWIDLNTVTPGEVRNATRGPARGDGQ